MAVADPISLLARELLKEFIGTAGPTLVRRKMSKNIPAITAGMEKKQMTLAHAAPGIVVRDALFRLLRSVIPSGDISDFLRDRLEESIKAKVVPDLDADADNTAAVVTKTMEALIDQVF